MINYEIQWKIEKSWNKKYRYKIEVIIYNTFVRNEHSLHKIRQMTYFIFTQFQIFAFYTHRISLKKKNVTKHFAKVTDKLFCQS